MDHVDETTIRLRSANKVLAGADLQESVAKANNVEHRAYSARREALPAVFVLATESTELKDPGSVHIRIKRVCLSLS